MAKNTSILLGDYIKELIKGEKSGFVKDFDRDSFLKNLKQKHSKE